MTGIVLVTAVLMLFSVPGAAADVTNPHIDTADKSSCLFCHVKGFEAAGAEEGDYSLLEDSIDAVCLTCHVKTECCRIGQRHMDGLFIGYSHPSDLDERDIRKESLPTTLPLQDGKMTCNTCHFHRRPEGRDYKLVRLVRFTDKGVEWTNLCQDCHGDV